MTAVNSPSVIRRVTMVGVAVNLLLTVVKITVGTLGHSDALVADGIHSLSDFASDIIVLVFVAFAYRKADSDHPYGHGKFETFASLLIAVVLIAVGISLGAGGVRDVVGVMEGRVLPVPSVWTIVVAALSIASKEWLFRYTRAAGRKVRSSSLEANAWHHRSDALSSVGTLIGVSAGYFLGRSWCVLDPIVTIVIAAFIVWSGIQIAMPSVNELLEKAPDEDMQAALRDTIASVPGVISFHRMRARRNGHLLIVDVHIKVDGGLSVVQGHEIATNTERALRAGFGPDTISYIHVEPYCVCHTGHKKTES